MRNRIDITEVEAGTKIRAKYLRALENEEWDLLPGPTFVKTFLRSYADYLGLDSRLLVEEYKQRYERPSTMELTPFAPRAGARRAGESAAGARSSARRSGWCSCSCWSSARSTRSAAGATTTRAASARPTRSRRRRRRRSRRAKKKKRCGAHACHPPDRAHRRRQRLPRRCQRARADRQRGAAGGRSDAALPRQALPGLVRQRPGADAGGQAGRSTSPTARRRSATRCGRASGRASCPSRGGRPAREGRDPHHRHRGAVGDHLRPQRAVAVGAPARARRRHRPRS